MSNYFRYIFSYLQQWNDQLEFNYTIDMGNTIYLKFIDITQPYMSQFFV